MEISDLSRQSNIPVSTIKFYLRAGLLPKPVKTGKTKAYYSPEYLSRLELIKKLQKEKGMSLKKISEIIEIIDGWKGSGPENGKYKNKNIKGFIIECAIKLFRKKGYDNSTIADIVEATEIGRGTFYKYFKNKKELFLECVKNIILNEAKITETEEINIDQENNLLAMFDKRSQAHFKEYPLWRDMINMLRVAAMNDPTGFAGQLEEAIGLKVNLFKKGMDKFIKDGLFKKVNPLVAAVMILGIQEYCFEYFSKATPETQEKIRNDVNNILLYGLLKE
jgi:AcrR family transcriptional regulator